MHAQTSYTRPFLTPHAVGVGLRSAHYSAALAEHATNLFQPDFIEVHAENFFSSGGANHAVLTAARNKFGISIHGTALGLGSLAGVDKRHLNHLKRLQDAYQPELFSDHAAFSIAQVNGHSVQAGDLLPIEFSHKVLRAFESNLHQTQDILGRTLLIENICTYIAAPKSDMSETEFLVELCERTGCGLLIDINNLWVNAFNTRAENIAASIKQWLNNIPPILVGEFHLAGNSPVAAHDIVVDDHSAPISPEVWSAYRYALEVIGPRPTLIEWDTDLPSWETLLTEAQTAKNYLHESSHHASIRHK